MTNSDNDKLMNQMKNHPAKTLQAEVNTFRKTLSLICIQNRIILTSYLNKTQNPDHFLPMADLKSENKRSYETGEILRLLSNYLSSVKSVIDHSRRISNNIFELPLANNFKTEITQYKKDLECFAQLDLSVFVNCLRNYIQHYGIPEPTLTIKFGQAKDDKTEFEGGYIFQASSLYPWNGWKQKAKQFLSDNENINLLDVVIKYSNEFEPLNLQLLKILSLIIKPLKDEYNKLVSEFLKKYPPITPDQIKNAVKP
ncbi:MAG: hypothetical protein LBM13_03495 [Candidatus Ancillula sp.]|jgi:hypothetical protein|nr:hypothetical protein [Candidatus Ancillula sp.]